MNSIILCILSLLQYHSLLPPVLLTIRTITKSLEELSRIPQLHPIHMSYVWMSLGNWEIMFSIELELLSDDAKWFPTHFTFYSPIEDIIRDIFYILRKPESRDDLLYSWKWSLIVTPVEERSMKESFCGFLFLSFRTCYGIHVSGILDSCIRRNDYFLSCERIVFIRYRLIVAKRTHRSREEFSPFTIFHHLLYNLRY